MMIMNFIILVDAQQQFNPKFWPFRPISRVTSLRFGNLSWGVIWLKPCPPTGLGAGEKVPCIIIS